MFAHIFRSLADKLRPKGKPRMPSTAVPTEKIPETKPETPKAIKKPKKYGIKSSPFTRLWKALKPGTVGRKERRRHSRDTEYKRTGKKPTRVAKAKASPTEMPPFNPQRRPHGEGIFTTTTRYEHKPWPFKKAS